MLLNQFQPLVRQKNIWRPDGIPTHVTAVKEPQVIGTRRTG